MPPMPDAPLNIAAYLPLMAQRLPDKRAIVCPCGRDAAGHVRYSHLTFLQLDQETDRLAHGLEAAGLRRGMRTLLMVRPSLDFFALTFALYKIGAVPVLIDPGMGRTHMVRCLASVEAEAFIGIPLAHLLRRLHPSAFRSIKTAVMVGHRAWTWSLGGHAIADIRTDPWRPYDPVETAADDPAAIIFTTGSTGPPKAVLYRHAQFDAQVRILRDYYHIQPDEIDLPTFPLFALFDPALGMTAVIPDMDPTRPADVDPTKIVEAIHDHGVTHMFGSPALLNRVGRYGEMHEVSLPSLRRVISAGAPVPAETLERFTAMLPEKTQIFTPYGATEALPIASIGSDELLGETRHETARGGGTCVGRPVPEALVRIIRISDEPIGSPPPGPTKFHFVDAANVDAGAGTTEFHFVEESGPGSPIGALPVGDVGEIMVTGPMVTREYLNDDRANALHKVRDSEGRIWHRMGDVGRMDEQGRLWFYGRKAHRVVTAGGTLFTEPVEAIFNQHPAVFRSALVGIGQRPNQTPVVCVELDEDAGECLGLEEALSALAAANPITCGISKFLRHPKFPVDIRHNSKIFRERLAAWAAERMANFK